MSIWPASLRPKEFHYADLCLRVQSNFIPFFVLSSSFVVAVRLPALKLHEVKIWEILLQATRTCHTYFRVASWMHRLNSRRFGKCCFAWIFCIFIQAAVDKIVNAMNARVKWNERKEQMKIKLFLIPHDFPVIQTVLSDRSNQSLLPIAFR